ncbi:MAG: hypothetical protein V8R80_11495 [Eubacterium sp.]
MDHAGRVIYLGTFSKSIAPSIRVSYMVLPMHLIKNYGNAAAFMPARCGNYAADRFIIL